MFIEHNSVGTGLHAGFRAIMTRHRVTMINLFKSSGSRQGSIWTKLIRSSIYWERNVAVSVGDVLENELLTVTIPPL